MPVTYTTPDGTTIDLDDGTTTRFQGLAGRGAPPVTPIETVVATGPGAALHRADVGVRQVVLGVRVLAPDYAGLDDRLSDFAAAMAGSIGGGPREGVLELTSFSGVVRRLRCLPVSGLDWAGDRQGLTIPASITFRASHPWWYGGTEQDHQITVLQPGDAGFPWTFPVSFGRDAPPVT